MRAQLSHVVHRSIIRRLETEQRSSAPQDAAYQLYVDSLERLKLESDERFLEASRELVKLAVSEIRLASSPERTDMFLNAAVLRNQLGSGRLPDVREPSGLREASCTPSPRSSWLTLCFTSCHTCSPRLFGSREVLATGLCPQSRKKSRGALCASRFCGSLC